MAIKRKTVKSEEVSRVRQLLDRLLARHPHFTNHRVVGSNCRRLVYMNNRGEGCWKCSSVLRNKLKSTNTAATIKTPSFGCIDRCS